MTRTMKTKRAPEGITVDDPLAIKLLLFYRAADARTKAAMQEYLKRVAEEKMPMDLAAGLYRLECAGADPAFIASWRRQQLPVTPEGGLVIGEQS
jgi:hypothetical protein